jgi:leucyl/phenylalanyl-tRNA--protein transferase
MQERRRIGICHRWTRISILELRMRYTCTSVAETDALPPAPCDVAPLALNTRMIDPEVLLQGYRLGVFPMAMEDGAIEWFSPDPRAILPLHKFHVPHTLERVVRKGTFEIRINRSFAEVMQECADRSETWINEEIIESYQRLHQLGHAHSVEAWQDSKLVGGLYGVAIGGAFFGESMFHHVRDASKVALLALVERLRKQRFTLLDTQWLTSHLRKFGAIEIPRAEYLHLLNIAVNLPRRFVEQKK